MTQQLNSADHPQNLLLQSAEHLTPRHCGSPRRKMAVNSSIFVGAGGGAFGTGHTATTPPQLVKDVDVMAAVTGAQREF